ELEASAAGTAAFRELAQRCGFDPDALVRAPEPPPRSEEARLARLAPEPIEVFSVGRILHHLATGAPLPGPDAIRAALQRPRPGRSPLDALPPAFLRVLAMLFAPTTATGRVTTL